MDKFIFHMKKYWRFIFRSAQAGLKDEVANSYLNWLWWILDPIFFMLIYTFVSLIVFKKSEPNFPIFVFIGLSVWNFFNRVIIASTKLMKQYKDIVSKVYVPKYILLLTQMFIQGFKMLISFGLVVVMMILWKVKISFTIFYFIPLMLLLFLFTFGFGTILLHYGVFIEDLSNLMNPVLRLVFYMSGIFYSIKKRVGGRMGLLLTYANPVAYVMDSTRDCLLYSQGINLKIFLLWTVIGLILSFIGVRIIYKYENSYAKVSK